MGLIKVFEKYSSAHIELHVHIAGVLLYKSEIM